MQGLRSFILDVPDLALAKQLYTDVLGKEPYFDQPFYVGFDVGGYELGLVPAESMRAITYFGVDDVPAAIAQLTKRGFTVSDEPQDVGEGIITASLTDPFGHPIGLIRNLRFAPRIVAASADDLSPLDIVRERVLPTTREKLWPLWSSTAGVTQWLVDEAHIELRPGGAYEVYFLLDSPRGSRGSETCRVLSFIPNRMLSFTWNAPPHLDKTRFQHTWVVVELFDMPALEKDAPVATRVVITHMGWPASGMRDEPQWAETFAYFETAWTGVLNQLEELVRTGVKPAPMR